MYSFCNLACYRTCPRVLVACYTLYRSPKHYVQKIHTTCVEWTGIITLALFLIHVCSLPLLCLCYIKHVSPLVLSGEGNKHHIEGLTSCEHEPKYNLIDGKHEWDHDEGCALMSDSGKWYDVECDTYNSYLETNFQQIAVYICEKLPNNQETCPKKK